MVSACGDGECVMVSACGDDGERVMAMMVSA